MPVLADAYLVRPPLGNRSVPSSPGRRVDFRANYARLTDPSDVVAVMKMDNVQIEVSPDWVDHLPGWLEAAVDLKADLKLPEGWAVEGEPGHYLVHYTELTSPTQDIGRMPNKHKGDCQCRICQNTRKSWADLSGEIATNLSA